MVSKFEGKYICLWCKHAFFKKFGSSEGSKDYFNNKTKKVLSVVTCPVCGNNLRPEKDAIKIKELKR